MMTAELVKIRATFNDDKRKIVWKFAQIFPDFFKNLLQTQTYIFRIIKHI